MVTGGIFTSDKNIWETPQSLFDELNEEFEFTLDAAASDWNHKLDNYYTIEEDGLLQDWGGQTVWCNPPYGNKETGIWTRKCYEESLKPNTTVVLLLPARTDRKSFHDYIYHNAEIRFVKGRLKFEMGGEPIGTAPFPSMLCIFGEKKGDNEWNTHKKEI